MKSIHKDIKLVFVGDTYIKNDFFILSPELKNLINKSDLTFCNLEGPLCFSNQTAIKKAGPNICQNRKSIDFLLQQGFNLFNLSNNHIMDYGANSLKKTIEQLPDNSYLGANLNLNDTYKPIIKAIDNIKIGFLAFSEWGFGALDSEEKMGYSWINHQCVNGLVKNTKDKVDFLIVQVHAGVEEIVLPLPEWRERYKQLIDLGADMIIGHHPHVVQGWEKYKEKYIFYSLGNFYMDMPNYLTDKGGVLLVSLNKNLQMNFNFIPIIKNHNEINIFNDEKYQIHLNKMSEQIIKNDYLEKINNICIKLWKQRYKNFYYAAFNKINIGLGIYFNLKIIIKFLLNKKINKTLLLHNLKIESHRFVVQRYLNLKNDR